MIITLMLFLALIMSFSVMAQQRRVTGVVTDQKDGSAIIGANVLEKGTSNGAVADVKGNFAINVSSTNPTLVIRSIGYKTVDGNIIRSGGDNLWHRELKRSSRKLGKTRD